MRKAVPSNNGKTKAESVKDSVPPWAKPLFAERLQFLSGTTVGSGKNAGAVFKIQS
jgi:hypothetical protein